MAYSEPTGDVDIDILEIKRICLSSVGGFQKMELI